MNLAEAIVKLLGDTKGLDSSITASKAKVNDLAKTGEQSVGRFSGAIGTGVKVAGVTAAIGFAAMSKGAMEMERAQGNFMAATGKSRDEAVLFSKDMNDLMGTAGAVGMTFEQVAETGTMVEQQFGTTGQATKDLTALILDFSKVTGQDATQAAGDLEDTLSAYGLEAEDAAGFTDQLVASAQKYGTEVGPAQLATLRSISPALQAMGGDIEDGIGLLNMFEIAGLDASAAQRGLNTAITQLPPGTTLDEYVKHLSDLKSQGIDPTQEAIDVFGNKAGAALAKAIQPGMDGLDDLGVSAEEAAGSVVDASKDMLTTSDKIKQFTQEVGAAARGLGQEFGPLVTGLASVASLATPFASGIKGMLARMLPQVLPAAAAAGAEIGLAQGTAAAEATSAPSVLSSFTKSGGLMSAALKVGLVLGVAAMAEEIGPQVGQAGHDIGRSIFGGIAEEMGSSEQRGILEGTVVDSLTDGIHTGLDNLMDSPIMRFNIWKDDRFLWMSPSAAEVAAAEGVGGLAAHIASEAAERLPGVAVEAATTLGEHLGDEMVDRFAVAAVEGTSAFANAMREQGNSMGREAASLAATTASGLVRGLRDGLPSVHDVWKQYVQSMNNALDPAKEAAWLTGKLTSKKLQQGLASENPFVRASAEDTRDALQSQLDDLHKLGYTDGEDLGQGVASGVNSQTDEVKDQAGDYLSAINALAWSQGGWNAGSSWASNFKRAFGDANIDAFIKKHVGDITIGGSPPPEGPLKHIDKGGYNIGKAWVGGIKDGIAADPLGGIFSGSSLTPGNGPTAAAGIRIDHFIHGDLPEGTSASEVAGILNRGVDASPLIRQIRAQGRSPQGAY